MGLMNFISGAGNLLDIPGSMARDVATLNNPFDQLLTPFSDENRMSGRDVLRQYGLAGDEDTWGNAAGGIAAEMILDPTNWLGGWGLARQGLKALKGAEKEGAKRLLKGMKATQPVLGASPSKAATAAFIDMDKKQLQKLLFSDPDEAAQILFWDSARKHNPSLGLLTPGDPDIAVKPFKHAYSRRAPFKYYSYRGGLYPAGGFVSPIRSDISYLSDTLTDLPYMERGLHRIAAHEATHNWQNQQPEISQIFDRLLNPNARMENAIRYFGSADKYRAKLGKWPNHGGTGVDWADKEVLAKAMDQGVMQGLNRVGSGPPRNPLMAYLNKTGLEKFHAKNILGQYIREATPTIDDVDPFTYEILARSRPPEGMAYMKPRSIPPNNLVPSANLSDEYARGFLNFLDSTTPPPKSFTLPEYVGNPEITPYAFFRSSAQPMTRGEKAGRVGREMSPLAAAMVLHNAAARQQ